MAARVLGVAKGGTQSPSTSSGSKSGGIESGEDFRMYRDRSYADLPMFEI